MEREIALWMMEFSRMLRSGVDVRLATSALRSGGSRITEVLSRAVEVQVEHGQPLAQAFSGWIRELDWLTLESAERAGSFVDGVDRVGQRMLDRVRWRQALLKQMAYPLILLCGTYGMFAFMVVSVLPTIHQLSRLTPERAASDQPVNPVIIAGACLFILSASLAAVPLSHLVKKRWPGAPIRPPFERLLRRIRTERLADQLASQLEAGIGAWEAVAWIAEREGALARPMHRVHEELRQGTSLHRAFAAERRAFDPLFLTLIEVGEITGEVADCLREGQRIMQLDIAHRLEAMVQMAEPVAVCIMGTMVGVLVYSLMAPLYQAIARLS